MFLAILRATRFLGDRTFLMLFMASIFALMTGVILDKFSLYWSHFFVLAEGCEC